MRYDSEHKARTRETVLKEAAAAIRAGGSDGISVAGLMARAGLTHGGFYAHFKSKDDLIAQAITYMFDERYAYFLSHVDQEDPATALSAFIDRYLSIAHRDAPGRGCPVPPLAAEVTRLPAAARKRFDAGVSRLTDAVAQLLAKLGKPTPAALAQSVLAELVGAIAMARAAANPQQAAAMLDASRVALKTRLGLAT